MKCKELPMLSAVLSAALLLCVLAGCGAQKAQPRSAQALIEEMVVDYGNYGSEASSHLIS